MSTAQGQTNSPSRPILFVHDYGNTEPECNNGLCTQGGGDAGFRGDVADLIALDATHGGAPIADLFLTPLELLSGLFGVSCVLPSVNVNELPLQSQWGPSLIEALNNRGVVVGGRALTDLGVPIQAIRSRYTDDTNLFTNWLPFGDLTGYSDTIVPINSQVNSNERAGKPRARRPERSAEHFFD